MRMQAIANTAGFHFGTIEQGGSSLYTCMSMKVTSSCPTILEGLLVRAHPDWKLEIHIDTDEANCCDLARASKVELIKE